MKLNMFIISGILILFCSSSTYAQIYKKVNVAVEKVGPITKKTISAEQVQELRKNCAQIKQNLSDEFNGQTNSSKFRETLNNQITNYLNAAGAPSSIHFLFLE